MQETGARNGSRTAPRLRKSEPVEGAKTNGTKLEVANEAARRRKPKQLCGPARPNSKPVWRYGCPQSQRPGGAGVRREGQARGNPGRLKFKGMGGRQRLRSIRRDRRKVVQPVEWWSGPYDPGRCREQMETRRSRSESRRRPSLSPIRLGQWGAPRAD